MTDYQALFTAITRDPHYRRNLDWGTPRPGHPEGTVRAHIAQLERNLARGAGVASPPSARHPPDKN